MLIFNFIVGCSWIKLGWDHVLRETERDYSNFPRGAASAVKKDEHGKVWVEQDAASKLYGADRESLYRAASMKMDLSTRFLQRSVESARGPSDLRPAPAAGPAPGQLGWADSRDASQQVLATPALTQNADDVDPEVRKEDHERQAAGRTFFSQVIEQRQIPYSQELEWLDFSEEELKLLVGSMSGEALLENEKKEELAVRQQLAELLFKHQELLRGLMQRAEEKEAVLRVEKVEEAAQTDVGGSRADGRTNGGGTKNSRTNV